LRFRDGNAEHDNLGVISPVTHRRTTHVLSRGHFSLPHKELAPGDKQCPRHDRPLRGWQAGSTHSFRPNAVHIAVQNHLRAAAPSLHGQLVMVLRRSLQVVCLG